MQALRKRMGNGALLHYGMGKWYPGEPLPRWILSCYWRADGVPVWEDDSLIAEEGVDYGYGPAETARFMEALTQRLGVESSNILPAFEPADPNAPARSAAGAAKAALLRARSHEAPGCGCAACIGHRDWRRRRTGRLRSFLLPAAVSPMEHSHGSSQLWFDKPERLELSKGDSPVGFRIPVEAVPWVAPDELKYEMDAAPFSFEQARGFPDFLSGAWNPLLAFRRKTCCPPSRARQNKAPVLVRSALCVQECEGRLHVFLPFVEVLADYLDLISAVEDTCRHLGMPVWLEGYAPAPDPRMGGFSATPDPGVLEINLPPAKNWDELESINTVLDEEAPAQSAHHQQVRIRWLAPVHGRRKPHRDWRSFAAR